MSWLSLNPDEDEDDTMPMALIRVASLWSFGKEGDSEARFMKRVIRMGQYTVQDHYRTPEKEWIDVLIQRLSHQLFSSIVVLNTETKQLQPPPPPTPKTVLYSTQCITFEKRSEVMKFCSEMCDIFQVSHVVFQQTVRLLDTLMYCICPTRVKHAFDRSTNHSLLMILVLLFLRISIKANSNDPDTCPLVTWKEMTYSLSTEDREMIKEETEETIKHKEVYYLNLLKWKVNPLTACDWIRALLEVTIKQSRATCSEYDKIRIEDYALMMMDCVLLYHGETALRLSDICWAATALRFALGTHISLVSVISTLRSIALEMVSLADLQQAEIVALSVKAFVSDLSYQIHTDKSDKENYMYRHITPYQFENTSNTESTSSSSISTTSLPDNNNNNR